MSIISFQKAGQLLDAAEVLALGPALSTFVTRFAPVVEVAPVGAPLILRVQNASGPTPSSFIEAVIMAGSKVAVPAIGSFAIIANATIYIRIISGPIGVNAASFLSGYFETETGALPGPTPTSNTFEAQVSTLINRGTLFNSAISGAVRRAIKFLETGNNFPYMRAFTTFTKDPDGSAEEQSSQIQMGRKVKRLEFVRSYDPSIIPRNYDYLTGVPAGDVGSLVEIANPEAYYTTYGVGVSGGSPQLLLNLVTLSFATAFNIETFCYTYTDYDNLDSSTEHWLLTVGESVVLAQTMLNLAPIIRQPEIIPIWAPILTVGLPNLLLAADEMDVDQHVQQIGYP